MKFVTLINSQYSDIAINFYHQLKKINQQDNFVVYCDSVECKNKIASSIPCENYLYVPSLTNLNNLIIKKQQNTSVLKPSTSAYSILNVIKHDVMYQYLTKNPNEQHVLLVDTDIIIFDDFTTDLVTMLSYGFKCNYEEEPSIFAFKYYLHFNRDLLYQLYYGKKHIVNTGFMLCKNTDETLKIIEKYYTYMSGLVINDFSSNIDELIITHITETNHFGAVSIPDQVHMVSDAGTIYLPKHIPMLKKCTKSFHITFNQYKSVNLDKITFMKQAGEWLI